MSESASRSTSPSVGTPLGQRAIVIGGSISGLLTARVLHERFAEVLVVERDQLPSHAAPRKGTPQAVHPHGLLARGREVIEALFPGTCEALVAQGAVMGERPQDILMMAGGRRFTPPSQPLAGIAVSRLALEAELRRRVRALRGVVVRDGVADAEPVYDPRAGRVNAVQLTERDGGAPVVVPAELVVDCTGRGSRSGTWLQRWGFAAPVEERVEVKLRYTSAYFVRDERTAGHPIGVICSATPELPRPAVMLAQEPAGDGAPRWVIATGGYADDQPEPTLEELRARTRSVRCTEMQQVAEAAPPLGEVLRYNFPFSVRRRYERLSRFPGGYLVMGDALTSFNPIYGQGMTTAACEALALQGALGHGLDGLHRRFFPAAARVIDIPWQLAVGSDLALPSVPGVRPLPMRLINGYVRWVRAAAAQDGVVTYAFARVVHLLDAPASLFAPPMLARVVWQVLRQRVREGLGERAAMRVHGADGADGADGAADARSARSPVARVAPANSSPSRPAPRGA